MSTLTDGAGQVVSVAADTTMADVFNTISPLANGSKWTTNVALGGTATLAANRLASKAGVSADSDVTVSFQVTDSGVVNTGRFIVSGRTQASGATGYRLDLKSDTRTARLVRRVANVDTVLAAFAVPAAGTEIRAQLSVVGTQVQARMWLANAAAPAWQACRCPRSPTATAPWCHHRARWRQGC